MRIRHRVIMIFVDVSSGKMIFIPSPMGQTTSNSYDITPLPTPQFFILSYTLLRKAVKDIVRKIESTP